MQVDKQFVFSFDGFLWMIMIKDWRIFSSGAGLLKSNLESDHSQHLYSVHINGVSSIIMVADLNEDL